MADELQHCQLEVHRLTDRLIDRDAPILATLLTVAELIRLHELLPACSRVRTPISQNDYDVDHFTKDEIHSLHPLAAEEARRRVRAVDLHIANLIGEQPRIFIASSSEALAEAECLAAELHEFSPAVWKAVGVFRPGRAILAELQAIARSYEFGIFLISPDDTRTSRDNHAKVPRDNVLFELGLFAGFASPECSIIVEPHSVDTKTNAKLPSDLDGIITVRYDSNAGIRTIAPQLTTTFINLLGDGE